MTHLNVPPEDDDGPQDAGDDLIRRDENYQPEEVPPEPGQYDATEIDDGEDDPDDEVEEFDDEGDDQG